MFGSNRRRTVGAGAIALTAAIVMTGCGTPPWAVGSTDEPVVSTSPSPTQSAAPQPVPNDLSSGSTERKIQAGSVAADVNYWSTLSMDRWTATALKPIQLSMVTTVTPNDGQQVYLQRASMIAVPGNATESFAPLTAQVDQSTVSPGYPVLDPYSYSQTFNVGEVPDGATFVTLQFTYEYLVQTTPTSSEYAKQTATDTLTVAIASGAE
ncbi:hypothetical protein DEU34_0494 [Microbacterium sp. AG1240]|uniref:hypothetical protein n=1 Tax=Microbacterium sp. AG1240 TaxID=2183992 RepID=UPI000EB034F2|nr:hypothetical protein [Microbacterium sp. AG1240]RKT35988.1 hypothetical protein DEU34_0494 [Microbacterium sp. AG1240]